MRARKLLTSVLIVAGSVAGIAAPAAVFAAGSGAAPAAAGQPNVYMHT